MRTDSKQNDKSESAVESQAQGKEAERHTAKEVLELQIRLQEVENARLRAASH